MPGRVRPPGSTRKRPAAAAVEAEESGGAGSTRSGPDAAERLAAAAERIAAAPERFEARSAGPEEATEVPVLPVDEGQFDLGELQLVLEAAEAGSDAGHVIEVLGFPPGHPKRGIAFAVVHGVFEVAPPTATLSGLSLGSGSTAGTRKRTKQ